MKQALYIKTDGEVALLNLTGKDTELPQLQKAVDGYIELVHTRTPRREMFVNEEGLIHDLPGNSLASGIVQPGTLVIGLIRGNAVLALRKGDIVGDESPVQTLTRMYKL